MNHELLFVEKVNQIAKGKETSSSSNHDDVSWLGGGQLKSFSSFAAHYHFSNFVFGDSLGEPSFVVDPEHDWNDFSS